MAGLTMKCPKCGSPSYDEASSCLICGHVPGQPVAIHRSPEPEVLRLDELGGRMMPGLSLGTDRSRSHAGLKKRPTEPYLGMMKGDTGKEHRARIRRGIQAAKAKGKRVGRPPVAWTAETVAKVKGLRAEGRSLEGIGKALSMSKRTVGRILLGGAPIVSRPKAPPTGKVATPTEMGIDTAALKIKVQREMARLQELLLAIEKVERLWAEGR